MSQNIFETNRDSGEYWISISDLMSVLMMIFLFISVVYMLNASKERDKIKEIAVAYSRLQNDLYEDLKDEFRNDLSKWNADIDKNTLSIRFKAPEVLFDRGKYSLKKEFKSILADFIPRYFSIIRKAKYVNDIEEIRIEGHTSSSAPNSLNKDEAYLFNMRLSQNRARHTLDFILKKIIRSNDIKNWAIERITANGLSFSKLKYKDNGEENKETSRRVEFRIRTNAEKRIVKILSDN